MATYFDDQNLSQPVLTRVDPTVDFDWGFAAPAEGMGKDTFSVRWTGKIKAQVDGQHTFLIKADNGARLWVDGKLLVNTGKGSAQSKGTINLKAGKSYSIRVEYYDNRDVALVRLLWQAKGLRRQVVPESQLTP